MNKTVRFGEGRRPRQEMMEEDGAELAPGILCTWTMKKRIDIQ